MIAFDVLGNSKFNYGFLGAYGNRAANFVAAKSDLLIAIGSRLDIRQVGAKRDNFAPNAKIIRIDIDEGELEYHVHQDEICFNMDLRDAVKMLSTLDINENVDWIRTCDTIKDKLSGVDDTLPNKYVYEISKYIPEGAFISTDVGQNQVWVAQSFSLKKGQRVAFSGGMGSMGHSLPAIIGAYYGGKKPLLCFSGDGGLQMNIQELQFIARENIPVKIIVFNNYALGMIRHFQEMYFDKIYYQTTSEGGYSSPDFVRIAEAYGIKGLKITSHENIQNVAEWLLDDDACLIEICINEDTYVVPKLEYGKPNQDQEPLIDRELYDELMKL